MCVGVCLCAQLHVDILYALYMPLAGACTFQGELLVPAPFLHRA